MKNKCITLIDLLVLKLKALYDTENQLIKALPDMSKNCSDAELKQQFQHHVPETVTQIERLESAFAILGVKNKKMKVEAIRGFVKDTRWLIRSILDPQTLDAALTRVGSYLERFQIADYLTAIEWARETAHEDIAALLQQNVEEKTAMLECFSGLGHTKIDERINFQ
jgi:ferritin-like metal-binding protein YciE